MNFFLRNTWILETTSRAGFRWMSRLMARWASPFSVLECSQLASNCGWSSRTWKATGSPVDGKVLWLKHWILFTPSLEIGQIIRTSPPPTSSWAFMFYVMLPLSLTELPLGEVKDILVQTPSHKGSASAVYLCQGSSCQESHMELCAETGSWMPSEHTDSNGAHQSIILPMKGAITPMNPRPEPLTFPLKGHLEPGNQLQTFPAGLRQLSENPWPPS